MSDAQADPADTKLAGTRLRFNCRVASFLFRMLRNNKISCVHNDSFTGLHNVRLLSLYDNQLTSITPGAFDTLQALSTL